MRLLSRLGWTSMPLCDVAACLRDRRSFPARRFALTFDDGDADLLWSVRPVLRTLGFQATVFVVSDYVGRRNDWEPAEDLRGRPLLSAADLVDLARDGWEIGAHSASHRNLTRLDPVELETEVWGCRSALESMLEKPIRCFCYPSGMLNAGVADAVRRAGYAAAVTTHRGRARAGDDPLRMPRVSISHRAGPVGLMWRMITAVARRETASP
jgi:peptidoglycan/xylan/chitin deacetylase (PgdA/CDA1 family)